MLRHRGAGVLSVWLFEFGMGRVKLGAVLRDHLAAPRAASNATSASFPAALLQPIELARANFYMYVRGNLEIIKERL
jgi:hypothetical protein